MFPIDERQHIIYPPLSPPPGARAYFHLALTLLRSTPYTDVDRVRAHVSTWEAKALEEKLRNIWAAKILTTAGSSYYSTLLPRSCKDRQRLDEQAQSLLETASNKQLAIQNKLSHLEAIAEIAFQKILYPDAFNGGYSLLRALEALISSAIDNTPHEDRLTSLLVWCKKLIRQIEKDSIVFKLARKQIIDDHTSAHLRNLILIIQTSIDFQSSLPTTPRLDAKKKDQAKAELKAFLAHVRWYMRGVGSYNKPLHPTLRLENKHWISLSALEALFCMFRFCLNESFHIDNLKLFEEKKCKLPVKGSYFLYLWKIKKACKNSMFAATLFPEKKDFFATFRFYVLDRIAQWEECFVRLLRSKTRTFVPDDIPCRLSGLSTSMEEMDEMRLWACFWREIASHYRMVHEIDIPQSMQERIEEAELKIEEIDRLAFSIAASQEGCSSAVSSE